MVFGIEDGTAGRDILDGLDERGGIHFLHQVTMRTRGDRIINQIIVRMGREDNHARFRQLSEDSAASVEPLAIGQANIQQHHFRTQSQAFADP